LTPSTLAATRRRNVVIASQEWFTSDVDFGVLGPIEVHDGHRELQLGGPKQRALLAVLLLNRNSVVSRDQLIDALWGDRPPASAAHTPPPPTTWALFAVVTAESYFSIPFLAVADLQNGLSKRKWDDAG
jgi:hypothetical protein